MHLLCKSIFCPGCELQEGKDTALALGQDFVSAQLSTGEGKWSIDTCEMNE